MVSFTFPEFYGWILFELMIIGFQIQIQGFFAGGMRRKLFSKEFYEKHFPTWKGKIHSNEGYPDMGSGRISDKLADSDWFAFNNAQRAHYNYLEQAHTVVIALVIAGLTYTRLSILLGAVYIIGRELYSWGYRSGGPKARTPGAITQDLSLLVLIITAFMSAWAIGGGLPSLEKLIKF